MYPRFFMYNLYLHYIDLKNNFFYDVKTYIINFSLVLSC